METCGKYGSILLGFFFLLLFFYSSFCIQFVSLRATALCKIIQCELIFHLTRGIAHLLEGSCQVMCLCEVALSYTFMVLVCCSVLSGWYVSVVLSQPVWATQCSSKGTVSASESKVEKLNDSSASADLRVRCWTQYLEHDVIQWKTISLLFPQCMQNRVSQAPIQCR